MVRTFAVVVVVLFVVQSFVASDFDSFKEAILEKHNKLREQHQAPPLELDLELSQSAQKDAELNLRLLLKRFEQKRLFFPKSGDSDDQSYNDNIWASLACTESTLNSNWVLAQWMNEENAYNWTNNYFDRKTGHFSQMIWKSSEDLGIGVAVATGMGIKFKYGTVVVLRYSPPGNVLDRDAFASNVLPPVSERELGYDEDNSAHSNLF